MLLFLHLLACPESTTDGEVPDDTGTPQDSTNPTYNPDSTVCGTVRSPDCGELPEFVEIWSIVAGESACADEGWDSGGAGAEWRDELIASLHVSGSGIWEAQLPAGEYAVTTSGGGCQDCRAFEVTEAASDECVAVDLITEEQVTADAPNVYLYPEQAVNLWVGVATPARITAAEPAYPRGGWKVWAEPDGRLHSAAGEFDYLFYELAMQRRDFQYEAGWCVDGAIAQATIEDALFDMGFTGPEVEDFRDYWDAVWPSAERVGIYPQIDRLPGLFVEPRPDTLVRAWFVVDDTCRATEWPELPMVERTGFTAAEWGVVILPPLPRVSGWMAVE